MSTETFKGYFQDRALPWAEVWPDLAGVRVPPCSCPNTRGRGGGRGGARRRRTVVNVLGHRKSQGAAGLM